MKKISFIVLAMFAFSYASFAQIDYGIRAGLNYSTMTGTFVDNTLTILDGGKKSEKRFMPAYHVNAYTRLPFNDLFYFQPELGISKKGVAIKVTDVTRVGNPNGAEELTVRYFNEFFYGEANLLFGLRTDERWRVHLGPQIGFLFEARRRLENEKTDLNTIDAFSLVAPQVREKFIRDAVASGSTPEDAAAQFDASVPSLKGMFVYEKRRPSIGLMAGTSYEFPFGLNIGLNADFMFIAPYKFVDKSQMNSGGGTSVTVGSQELFNTLNIQLSVGYTIAPHNWYRTTHRNGTYRGRR
jgi:hypothetical protein